MDNNKNVNSNAIVSNFNQIQGGLWSCLQWKRINCKQSARWQHLSRLKASAVFFEIFLLGVKKHTKVYLRLVMPSSG